MAHALTPEANRIAPPGEPLAPLAASFRAALARSPGALTLADVESPLPDLLDAFAASKADAFFWQQPSQNFSLLGLGAAVSIEPQGDARCEDAIAWWREQAASAVAVPGSDAQPVAVGGMSYAEQATHGDGVWSDWPRGAWVAPAVVLERRGNQASAQLQAVTAGAADDAIALLAEALAAPPDPGGRDEDPEIVLRDDPDHDWWDGSMRVVLDAIAAGELRKQVLARRVCAFAARPLNVTAVLRRLRERFPTATIFAVRRNGATFVGASPEELVGLRGDSIEAAALAGTSRGADGSALLDDPKERREHAFVVDALVERLAPFCAGLDVPAGPQLMSLPNLAHLYTPVRGRLASARGLLELIADLHPTPAVGAVPRDADRAGELEPFDRGWYAGAVGWTRGDRGGNGAALVALRSALIRDDHAALYAGCGIVEGSEPEREWREARLKMEAVRGALGVHIDKDASSESVAGG